MDRKVSERGRSGTGADATGGAAVAGTSGACGTGGFVLKIAAGAMTGLPDRSDRGAFVAGGGDGSTSGGVAATSPAVSSGIARAPGLGCGSGAAMGPFCRDAGTGNVCGGAETETACCGRNAGDAVCAGRVVRSVFSTDAGSSMPGSKAVALLKSSPRSCGMGSPEPFKTCADRTGSSGISGEGAGFAGRASVTSVSEGAACAPGMTGPRPSGRSAAGRAGTGRGVVFGKDMSTDES